MKTPGPEPYQASSLSVTFAKYLDSGFLHPGYSASTRYVPVENDAVYTSYVYFFRHHQKKWSHVSQVLVFWYLHIFVTGQIPKIPSS